MKRYRSKPAHCYAEPFGGFYVTPYPEGVEMDDNSNDPEASAKHGRYAFYVVTCHGQKTYIQDGDVIVREPNGRGYYPVKPEIFAQRWEEDSTPTE